MDINGYITGLALGVLSVWIFGPYIRRHFHKRVLKEADYPQGVPTAVCSKCHKSTARFFHPPEGGTLCWKCSNWS